MSDKQARLRRPNDAAVSPAGDDVLYWMQLYRRFERFVHAARRARRDRRLPFFIVPPQTEALAGEVQVPVVAVDSTSLVPLSVYTFAFLHYAAVGVRVRF